MFNDIYRSRRIAITGHTGFKGSWLSVWLTDLGAIVSGFSLDVPTNPSHYTDMNLQLEDDLRGDVGNRMELAEFIKRTKPELVIHMAAQSLVRPSYEDPLNTFATNTMGTANVLNACLESDSVKAVIIVTSDKCYENDERNNGYKETDRLGGFDPYSASKGCAEIITESYRRSFASTKNLLVASVRAGNVIGGGDWARDRLIPDIARAVMNGEKITIRRPDATRPWQHVLEPLSGYLLLGRHLLEGDSSATGPWNFGPKLDSTFTVRELVSKLSQHWEFEFEFAEKVTGPHETNTLTLDCSKANSILNWNPIWSVEAMLKNTSTWYKEYLENHYVATVKQYKAFIDDAKTQEAIWIN